MIAPTILEIEIALLRVGTHLRHHTVIETAAANNAEPITAANTTYKVVKLSVDHPFLLLSGRSFTPFKSFVVT